MILCNIAKILQYLLKKILNKIIEEYNVDNNNISIEHINFIVIGSAGVGKSAFINETLLLEGNKKSK